MHKLVAAACGEESQQEIEPGVGSETEECGTNGTGADIKGARSDSKGVQSESEVDDSEELSCLDLPGEQSGMSFELSTGSSMH